MRKEQNVIEIVEDTKIPGTDIILEKGDKITVQEAKISKNDQQVIKKHIDYLKAVGNPGKYKMPAGMGYKTKDEVMALLKGMGLSDLEISKLKIGRMKPSEIEK